MTAAAACSTRAPTRAAPTSQGTGFPTGAPSDNGLGGGNAYGRPCAGCVGNADQMNPPGQSPNDLNRGFECDLDSGIGRTNPAAPPLRDPLTVVAVVEEAGMAEAPSVAALRPAAASSSREPWPHRCR